MAITANSGPLVEYGTVASTLPPQEYNTQRGISLFDCGVGMLDSRVNNGYLPGGANTYPVKGFLNGEGIIDAQLSSASSKAFAVSSATTPTASAALTLTPSTAAGIITTTIVTSSGATATVYCIGSTAVTLPMGQDGTISIWNPAAIAGRAIAITTSSSGDNGSWTVNGYDIYSMKLTELIPTSSITTTGRKAFKFIASIYASSVIASTGVGIGFGDAIGFPLFAPDNGYNVQVNIISLANSSASGTVSLTSASFVAGSTTTATSTTADVRGMYTSTTAMNSSLRMQVLVYPKPSQLQALSITSSGGGDTTVYGLTQYSNF